MSLEKKITDLLISSMNIDSKILYKIIEKSNSIIHKRIMHHDQVAFILGMEGCLSIYKSINVITTLIKWRIKII